jgi:hypothetical protein
VSKSEAPAPEGQISHPTRLVVKGHAPGSEGYIKARADHQTDLMHFVAKNEQYVRLSGLRSHRSQIEVRGARITYQNNEGQAQVTLELRHEAGSEEEQTTQGEKPWEFALVEFTIRNSSVNTRSDMAAFLAKPLIPTVKAINADSFLPLDGVTEDSYYPVGEKDLLKFAGQDSNPMLSDYMETTDRVFSLHVDLRKFPFQTIAIEIYAYAQTVKYYRGGAGIDTDGTIGECVDSTLFGSLTYDWRGLNGTTYSPAALAAAPKKLFTTVAVGSTPGFYDALIETFPELAGVPHEALTDGKGDENVVVSFKAGSVFYPSPWINTDYTTAGWGDYLGTHPGDASPNNSPNGWGFLPLWTGTWIGSFDNMRVYQNWAPGFYKKVSLNNSVQLSPYGGSATVSSYYDPIPSGSPASAVIYNAYSVRYYVPTWKYVKPPSPVTITGVCVQGGNPWDAYSQHFIPGGGGEYSRVWEHSKSYPTRPPMATLKGTFKLPNSDRDGDMGPINHFGLPHMGTLHIDTRGGGISFKPA